MVNFEISGFDLVGLVLKIDRYGLLRVKNRQFPVLTGNAWAEVKSDVSIFFLVPGSPHINVLTQLLSRGFAVITIFRFISGFNGTSG